MEKIRTSILFSFFRFPERSKYLDACVVEKAVSSSRASDLYRPTVLTESFPLCYLIHTEFEAHSD
jgi:hypothetical protein